jgi:putative flavoprotein involved in K+ transport
MDQLLARIESYIEANGLASEVLAAQPRPAVAATPVVPELDLHASGITNVVWATGYRRSYPWLRLRVLDRAGEIRQRRGVTPVQGLYVVGQRFQYRRNSNFIGGVGRDAAFIAERITARHTATGRHPSACARTDS